MLVWRRWARQKQRATAWARWLEKRRRIKEVMVLYQCSIAGLTAGLRELADTYGDLSISLAAFNDVAEELRDQLATTDRWHPVLLAAHSAMVSMGEFREPLDPELVGLSYGQWQLERARRISLAVLKCAAVDANSSHNGQTHRYGWIEATTSSA